MDRMILVTVGKLNINQNRAKSAGKFKLTAKLYRLSSEKQWDKLRENYPVHYH
jgi:hypothetical protein